MNLNTQSIRSMADVQAFLDGTLSVDLAPHTQEAGYQWIAQTLAGFDYPRLARRDKGVLQAFLRKVSGYSRAQVTRLIAQWRKQGRVADRRGAPAKPFSCRYGPQEVACLIELDRLHGTLSGGATKKLAERAATQFGDARYAQLAKISNGHLYNLRKSQGYRRARVTLTKTVPRHVAIGERRRPDPQGIPGYLRVDSVHQGDWDGVKGVYYINLVDEVTQFEVVLCVARISENFLLPRLEEALAFFPFVIRGFHSDNGSEYINHRVAELLAKLHAQMTKSRPRHSNDNGLVEAKNGAIVRKHFGYAHIPSSHADAVHQVTLNDLTPYLNFHRPCFFAQTRIDAKGRQRKYYRYEDMMTPFDKLASLPNLAQHLKPGITLDQLRVQANAMTDNQAAEQLSLAKQELFNKLNKRAKIA